MLARLKTIEGFGQGDVLSLDGYDVVTIGRTHSNTVQVRERDVSRTHCRIQRLGAVWQLVDADSRNGTFLNGERAQTAILKRDDKIQVGKTTFEIELLPGKPDPSDLPQDLPAEETVGSSAMFPSDITTADSVSATPLPARGRAAAFSWLNPVVLFILSFALTVGIGAAVMALRGGHGDASNGITPSAPGQGD